MEKNQFTIGKYTFSTYHEYRDGQEDMRKIDAINAHLDIHDPETAVRLYNLIRNGEITFRSPIGEEFSAHVADIVAVGSEGLLEDKADEEDVRGQVRYQRIAGIAVAVFAVALFVYFGVTEARNLYETRRLAKLQESVAKTEDDGDAGDPTDKTNDRLNDIGAAEVERDPYKHEELIKTADLDILPEYSELYEQNNDLVGWLTIPQTDINYPVMQKDGDNSFYLSYDYDGVTEKKSGTLFVDYRSDTVNPTTNTIIYGHNMHDGTMFGTLSNYLDETYYNEHKTVQFNTIYEYRTYEIVAVCLSEVEYQDNNGYRYYNFIQAGNRAEWNAFVSHVNSLSVHGSGVDLNPEEPDELLTLSTCNNYVQDGRLFLVAKRVTE